MLKVFISYGNGAAVDYSRYIASGSIKITRSINVPSTCSLTMANYDDGFKMPPQRCYVRIWSTQYNKNLFTGFLTNDPTRTFAGLGTMSPDQGQQIYAFAFTFTSDEYLLSIKSVPFIPAYINQSQGAILQSIAETLCPGYFDFTYCASGDIVPYFLYDPSHSWSEIAKEFGDASRYRYSAINREIHFQPYGDGALGISYDENAGQGTFDPNSLTTSAMTTPIVNDVTMVGKQEAGDNHEDFFVGTGFVGNFPLKHQVFGLATAEQGSSILINENWQQGQLNTQYWQAQDPGDNFNYNVSNSQSLNVITGLPQKNGTSFIASNNAFELAGGLSFQHGEIQFNDTCQGMIGGIYDSTVLNGFQDIALDDNKCEAGFYITPTASVDVTASGASGISITAFRLGSSISGGFNIITKVNKSYVLSTHISAPQATRYTQVYRSIAGSVFGSTDPTTVSGTITWAVLETDDLTGFQTSYNYTTSGLLPVTALYVPVNNVHLNISLQSTIVSSPVPGSLNIRCEIGAGALGAIYVSGNVQFTGGFVAPSGGNLPIAPSGIGNEIVFPLGTSLQNQAAEIDSGQVTSTLNFYGDDLPGVGVRIRLQSWESQAAIARMRDTISVQNEAAVVGDDGVRSSIVTNLNPLPRTSEDCENAAQAFLHDRTNTFYQGTYKASYYFFDQMSDDIDFYPVCGRYLFVNAPRRNMNKEFLLVTAVTTTVTEMAGEIMQHNISFGPDMFLEKLLATIIPVNPNQLTNLDTSVQPPVQELLNLGATYYKDVTQSTFIGTNGMTGVSGAAVTLALLDSVPYGARYEVRSADLNWGMNDQSLILASGVTGIFQLPRLSYEQVWYIRFAQGVVASGTRIAQVQKSRRAKVLRVVYPRVPTIPAKLYIDSRQANFDFTGDIRNIEGIEFRGPWQYGLNYTVPSGAYHITGSRSVTSYTTGVLWDNFVINSALPPDAVITGIYPVAIFSAVKDGCGQWFVYGTDAALNVGNATFPNIAFPTGGTDFKYPYDPTGVSGGTFTETEFWSDSIGTSLSALNGQRIGMAGFASLVQDGLTDAATIFAVGFAVYYKSVDAIVDPSISPPFPVPQGTGLAWALPLFTTNGQTPFGVANSNPSTQIPLPSILESVDRNIVFYQGIVGSQQDMALDLRTLRGQSGPGQALQAPIGFYQRATVPATLRDFEAAFFNLLWEYGPPLDFTIPPPSAPVLKLGTAMSGTVQIIDTQQDNPPRQDIASSTLQIATDAGFNNVVLVTTISGDPGTTQVNLATSGSYYGRMVYSDYISSGAWSNVVQIPHSLLIQSTYLVNQGSVPPVLSSATGASGGIFSYEAYEARGFFYIVLFNIPFTLVFPDGSQIAVAGSSGLFGPRTQDAYPITPSTQYGFFPFVTINGNQGTLSYQGPFLNYSAPNISQLFDQFQDGTVAVTNGPFIVTSGPAGSSSGGGGGGTHGGGNCGVLSSLIELADGGTIPLSALQIGTRVRSKQGVSKVFRMEVFADTTMELTTETGRKTRAGVGHVLHNKFEWLTLVDLYGESQEATAYVETVDGFERVVNINDIREEKICRLHLEPEEEDNSDGHVYVLDGFWAHNILIKFLTL